MSDKTTKSPQIRFAGFTDAWEQRKLVDNVEEVLDYRGKSPARFGMEWGNEGCLVLSALNVKDGYIDKSVEAKYGDQELFEIWMGEHRLEKGDVLFTTEAPLGNVAQVPDDEDYILNQRTVAFKTDSRKTSDNFLAQLLRSPLVQEKLNANASGGTAKGIGMKEFAKLTARVPTPVEEQNKIGAFFSNIDNLITLHQSKLELLKRTKKSLLQKMFPKEGANVPEIRFAGFTVAWEQRKLGGLANIVRGASPRPIQDPKWFDVESDIGWLRISDVTEQDGRIYYLKQRISKAGQEKTRVLTEPHLLLSIAATVGKPVVNYVKTGVHDGFLIFQNPKFDREFMFQWLEMFRLNWQKYGQPGSQVNLNSDLVKNQEIMMPSEEEQKKIGDFFAQLDHLITLHQRELNSLKNLKKSLLQQMFI